MHPTLCRDSNFFQKSYKIRCERTKVERIFKGKACKTIFLKYLPSFASYHPILATIFRIFRPCKWMRLPSTQSDCYFGGKFIIWKCLASILNIEIKVRPRTFEVEVSFPHISGMASPNHSPFNLTLTLTGNFSKVKHHEITVDLEWISKKF